MFKEQGTLDDMGVGTIRDVFSNQLFPGVTSVMTRMRYALFIPWTYKLLEASLIDVKRITEIDRQREVRLIDTLLKTQKQGVIGTRSREKLHLLPSSIYWSCLQYWGIFVHSQHQYWYHANFQQLRHEKNWHPKLPEIPPEFPNSAAFELSNREASFIREQIELNCPGTLLAYLATRTTDLSDDYCWDLPDVQFAPKALKFKVELARRFSLIAEGINLVYYLMLAQTREEKHQLTQDGLIESYETAIGEWAQEEAAEADRFDLNVLWGYLDDVNSRVKTPTKEFIRQWVSRMYEIKPERIGTDTTIRELVRNREKQLKGSKLARLTNVDRLRDWDSRYRKRRLDFNWYRAKVLLQDLQQGLGAC